MKKNLLYLSITVVSILVVTILIPSVLVALWPSEEGVSNALVELQVSEDDLPVKVWLTDQQKLVTLPLEQYVRGVVAAEMPVDFAPEALKAQAVAARTYVVRRIKMGQTTPEGADVTDNHQTGQQYATDAKLEQRWGLVDYAQNLSKINQAVNETKGLVALYKGAPIEALFFSTSSGRTENSEDYWENTIPYLRSVESPWDLKSDKYKGRTEMSLAEFSQKLGLQAVPTAGNLGGMLQPLERTATDHIRKIRVGDNTLSGRDFRAKLGLRSTLVTWQVTGDKIVFESTGFGHGVGLSQYGANGMAQEGRTAEEILKHYYQGIELGQAREVVTR